MFKRTLLVAAVLLLATTLSGCFNKQLEQQVTDNTSQNEVTQSQEESTVSGLEMPIDITKSNLEWRSKKIVSTSEHHGLVSFSQGKLIFDKQTLIGGNFVVDMTSLSDQDLQGEMKSKLEEHLKSADFFDVVSYPRAELTIKSAALASSTGTSTSDSYNITADLTIKGVTNSVEFPATIERQNGSIVAKAELAIDRSLWNVKYGSGKFFDDLGDKAIDDSIRFKINLEAQDLNAPVPTPSTTSTPSTSSIGNI